MKPILKIGFLIFFIGVLHSCKQDVVFNQYESLDKAQWPNGQVVAIEIPIKDTVSFYNLYINLRNTNQNPKAFLSNKSRLWLIQ